MRIKLKNEYEKMYYNHLEGYLDLIKGSTLESWATQYLTGGQKYRYLATLKELQTMVFNKKILDLAALPFYLDYLLLKELKAQSVDCTDINPHRLNIENINDKNLRIMKNNLEEEELRPNKKYDIILFLEIFEHLRMDLITVFDNIKKVMHDRSILILAFPNLYFYRNIFRYLTGKGILNYYYQYEKLKKYGHMGHVRLPSYYEVKKFLKDSGFYIIDAKCLINEKYMNIITLYSIFSKNIMIKAVLK